MKSNHLRISAYFFLAALTACATQSRQPAGEKPAAAKTHASAAPHWGYAGHQGPEHWAKLHPEWKICADGKKQSPIDLRWQKPQSNRKIEFDYKASPLRMIDNGHTLQVNFEPGSYLLVAGDKFQLVQMHFHTQSEHALSNKRFPLEAHFVHQNEKGQLAVVGVFFKQGKKNELIEKLWALAPHEKNKEIRVADQKIDALELMPRTYTHYHYEGSLTTPPCSEGVNWNIFNTPLEISKEQLARFQQLYVINARPLQQAHGRKPANY